MSRFYFNDIRFRVVNQGSMLAGFSVVDNETGVEYNGFKLIQGKNGPFISSPADEYIDKKTGEKKYSNYVQAAYDKQAENNRNPKGDKWFQELLDAAYQKYQSSMNSGGTATAGASTGRGPVAASSPAPGVSTDGSDLPF